LQNQVTGVGLASLSFDANGNMTVDEQGRTFIWDAWNRLVEVKQGSTTLVEYQYDGLKRRIVEDDGTSERHLYYSDQWQVLEQRVGGDTTVQYVWSAVYVDAMILRERDADANTGNGLEERIYVLHDANYNVTAIVDTSGEVLERYYYEAYGRAVYLDDAFALQPDGQSDHAWLHLHQGGRLVEATGDYHFRHRDLSPTLGRWISQDPIGFEAGDANLYRYVGNGPGNYLDSDGLIRFPGGLPLISVSPWSLGTASWDDVQRGLDLLGFVPVLGAGPDLVNVGIDFLRGNTESGAINLVAAIPLWGDEVKAAKIVNRGMNNPVTRTAVERGRQVHQEFANKMKEKPGWLSQPRIKGPNGETLYPDAIDPKGRPVELKPNTPSGRAKGAKQIEQYKEATGTNGRVVYYNP
jgi:RHS repeat-associated protein